MVQRKKAKQLEVGDVVVHKGDIWRVKNTKVQKEEGEMQYSYNHHDKKEVAFQSKGKKRVVTHLQCPKTGESYMATHKPNDLVQMADKAIVDVLYAPPKIDDHVSGNLTARDHVDERITYFGYWTDEDDGQ